MNKDFDKAYKFLFDETYIMWYSDLKKIFRIGTRGTKGGCNLSSCILVLIGIESFSKFFSNYKKDDKAFEDFIDTYYPAQYHGKMKNIYYHFRHGLAHNFYPKKTSNSSGNSLIAFGQNEKRQVVSLSRLKADLENCRKRTLKLDPDPGKPIVIVPQVLFLDTVEVMEKLKELVKKDAALQSTFINNHNRVRKILRHKVN